MCLVFMVPFKLSEFLPFKRNWYIFMGDKSARIDFISLLKKGLLLKERICSLGSKFFPLRVDPFSDGDRCASKVNRELQKLSPLYKMADSFPCVTSPLKLD